MTVPEKKRVLLLEDEADVRFMMNEMLELLDCNVDLAANAAKALELSEKNTYDYYLIDIIMEGESGLDALLRMPVPDIPSQVILVSANINALNFERASAMGVTKFLTKPIKMSELEKMMS
jgi:DNA-binding NtrC family response regulator